MNFNNDYTNYGYNTFIIDYGKLKQMIAANTTIVDTRIDKTFFPKPEDVEIEEDVFGGYRAIIKLPWSWSEIEEARKE